MSPVASVARQRQVLREEVSKAVVRIVRRGEESVSALADRLGVARQTIVNWSSGSSYPTYTMTRRVATSLGVSV